MFTPPARTRGIPSRGQSGSLRLRRRRLPQKNRNELRLNCRRNKQRMLPPIRCRGRQLWAHNECHCSRCPSTYGMGRRWHQKVPSIIWSSFSFLCLYPWRFRFHSRVSVTVVIRLLSLSAPSQISPYAASNVILLIDFVSFHHPHPLFSSVGLLRFRHMSRRSLHNYRRWPSRGGTTGDGVVGLTLQTVTEQRSLRRSDNSSYFGPERVSFVCIIVMKIYFPDNQIIICFVSIDTY